MAKSIPVKANDSIIYHIELVHDFSMLPAFLQGLGYGRSQKICIVTDSNVAPLYARDVQDLLEKEFDTVILHTFEAGEHNKNLETVNSLYQTLIEQHFDRQDLLVALGGGVVGDLTGFAAATYLRGIDFIQMPTTLLSQVDSSIGGKTGVDFMQYKNMVGAFYQPKLVYMNLSVLQSLPSRQIISGMGEIIKHGLIKDAAYYEWLMAHHDAILALEPAVMEEMIARSCEIKREVVEHDPTEKGERALLNFGHTIGHAIEKVKSPELLHGQCVALGSVAAAYISFKRGLLSTEEFYEIRDMNVGFDLSFLVDGINSQEILRITKSDKKMDAGRVKFILLKGIGKAFIDHTVTDEEMLEAIEFLNAYNLEKE